MRGKTLTIYSSGPMHGPSAAAGEAVFAGQRYALERAGGRAGGRRVRLVRLPTTRPGDARWDPAAVKANAERARDDPSAIAYLGELDHGASAVSLPVTNESELLQVSPTDGLTSLTRAAPGRASAGPEPYYPGGRRTFARLVPNDRVVAAQIVALLGARDLARVSVLAGEAFADREFAAILVSRLRATGVEPVFVRPLMRDAGSVPALVGELGTARPEVVVLAGTRGPSADAAVAALARTHPDLPVVGTAGLIGSASVLGPRARAVTPVLPAPSQPAPARRLLERISRASGVSTGAEALYGFEAMRLVLDAIDDAGPDRRAVVRAVLAPVPRATVLGPMTLDRHGDVRSRRVALLRFRGGRPVVERVIP